MKSHFVSPDLRPCFIILPAQHRGASWSVEKSTEHQHEGLCGCFRRCYRSDYPGQLPPSSLFSSHLPFMQSPPLHKALLHSKSLPAGRGIVSDHCPQFCHANAAFLLCQASSMLFLPLAQRSLESREYFEGILKTVF